MDLHFYHLTFATRAQANAFVAQERALFPKELYDLDLVVAPRTDRPWTRGVPEALQEVRAGNHQWAVDGSRLVTPKAR